MARFNGFKAFRAVWFWGSAGTAIWLLMLQDPIVTNFPQVAKQIGYSDNDLLAIAERRAKTAQSQRNAAILPPPSSLSEAPLPPPATGEPPPPPQDPALAGMSQDFRRPPQAVYFPDGMTANANGAADAEITPETFVVVNPDVPVAPPPVAALPPQAPAGGGGAPAWQSISREALTSILQQGGGLDPQGFFTNPIPVNRLFPTNPPAGPTHRAAMDWDPGNAVIFHIRGGFVDQMTYELTR